MYDVTENLVEEFQDSRDVEGFNLELIRLLSIDSNISEKEFLGSKTTEVVDKTFEHAYQNYISKSERIAQQTYPVISDVYLNQSTQYQNIAIPMTDGVKTINIITNLEKAYKSKGSEVTNTIEKSVSLSIIDNVWKEHLREMDDLKQSVQNASYEQKDPLLIYKFESFELFKKMVQRMNKETISFLIKCDLPENKEPKVSQAVRPAQIDLSKLKTSHDEYNPEQKFGHSTQQQQITQPIRVEKKVGRNEPCPCGSGKKYKNCHGVE